MPPDPHLVFWRRTRQLSGLLLLLWLAVTLCVPWFARDAHGASAFGFPLSYWAAAVGALLVYLAVVVVYSVAMDRLERQLAEDSSSSGKS